MTLILAGDFRENLPVISCRTIDDAKDACVKSFYLWWHVEKRHTTRNKTFLESGNEYLATFALQHLGVNNATGVGGYEAFICLSFGKSVSTFDDLIPTVVPDIDNQ